MATLAEPDIDVKLLKERHRIEKARRALEEERAAILRQNDSMTFVFCSEPGCDWEAQFSNVNSALASAHAHADVKGHVVDSFHLVPGSKIRPRQGRSFVNDVRR